jgi:prepilin-type N-terminal cleavage/methylation domain-containing protein
VRRSADNGGVRTLIDRARAERGFTLVELLVASMVLVIVLMATLTALDGSKRLAAQEVERGHAITDARAGLDRMVRELRHATAVTTPTANSFTVTVARRGVTTTNITFECNTALNPNRCARRVNGSAPGEPIVEQLRVDAGDGPVFSYVTTAAGVVRHVAVRLPIRLDGGPGRRGYSGRAVLRDGTELRNG